MFPLPKTRSAVRVVTALLVLAASPVAAHADQIVNRTSPIGFRIINGVADTVHPLDGYALTMDTGLTSTVPSSGAVASSRSVIGPDDRGEIKNPDAFPYRTFGAVDFNGIANNCTGWLVSPDTMVTAGHCVTVGGEISSYLTFSPGRSGTANGWGTAKAIEIWTDRNFVTTPNHDWGVVKLDQPVGLTVGWIGFRKTDTTTLTGTTQTISGYPADKPDGTMWSATGPIQSETASSLAYSIDTFGGQSGSPIYEDKVAIGIHVAGGGNANGGTRISNDLFDVIVNISKR